MTVLSNGFDLTTSLYNVRNINLTHILTLHLGYFDENRRSLNDMQQVHWMFVMPYRCIVNSYSVRKAHQTSPIHENDTYTNTMDTQTCIQMNIMCISKPWSTN